VGASSTVDALVWLHYGPDDSKNTMFKPAQDRFAAGCIALVVLLELMLGISPKADRLTWVMENAPVWIGISVWLWMRKRFQLSRLCLVLFSLHALILMVGGYYTYARVPLGDWVRDWFGLARNHYDRLGHLAQGFIPAIFVRELLLRVAKLPRSRWIPVLVVSVCLAFSAFYEFIEWWTAVLTGDAATDFLGTQGDPWDTQWDMFLAFCGTIAAQLALSKFHDRSMRMVEGD
jgi:putative membrane protein